MNKFSDLYKLFIRGSKLICSSNHTTPEYNISEDNHLTVVIEGKSYNVLYETENSEGHFSIEMIYEFIKKGCPLQVEFSFRYSERPMKGFIHFNDDILQNLPFSRNFYQQIQQPLNFTVNIFDVEWVDIRFAKQSDMRSCLIASLGFFKYHNFIQRFIRMVNFLPEYRIIVLWEMFIYSLSKIGYFDIFDINHFQSIVLMTFFNIFKIFKHTLNNMVLKNLFLSFIQQLLSNNCWFIIVGDKYRPIRGRPSSSLIDFFSCLDLPPFANMVYDELIQGQSELFPDLNLSDDDEE